MSKRRKKFSQVMKSFYPTIILVTCLLMSIGYATLNFVDLQVIGDTLAEIPRDVYISDAEYVKRNGSLPNETANVEIISNNVISTNVILEPNVSSSQVSVLVTLHNNSGLVYRFKNIIYDESFEDAYTNDSVEMSFDKANTSFAFGESLDITITFKYKDGVNLSNNQLSTYLLFEVEMFPYVNQLVKREAFSDSGYANIYAGVDAVNFDNDVYYFTNGATNINVIFGGFCWEMIRTTETGGTKMIYNGIPSETGTCNNTGRDTQLARSKYNIDSKSIASAGYMTNSLYPQKTFFYGTTYEVLTTVSTTGASAYYYSDSYEYDGTNYVLKNSDGGIVGSFLWSDNYSKLKGYYRCKNGSATSCTNLYYVVGTNESNAYVLSLTSGYGKNDVNTSLSLAPSYTKNADGTYTLNSVESITKEEWFSYYGNYNNYYMCSNMTGTTCSNIYVVSSTTISSLQYNSSVNEHLYGNTFTYDDTTGLYTLVDTVSSWEWGKFYSSLNDYHYTCLNGSGVCSSISYVYVTNIEKSFYINIENGLDVDAAMTRMLASDEANQSDSAIKEVVDDWYASNLISYSSYIEDTIYCNDRSVHYLAGWNPNGGSMQGDMRYSNFSTLTCKNKSDRFTVDSDLGNQALTYPIGLLEGAEMNLRGKSLNANKDTYWVMAAYNYRSLHGQIFGIFIDNNGNATTYAGVDGVTGVRPVISLKSNIEYSSGDGSVNLPYIINTNN